MSKPKWTVEETDDGLTRDIRVVRPHRKNNWNEWELHVYGDHGIEEHRELAQRVCDFLNTAGPAGEGQ